MSFGRILLRFPDFRDAVYEEFRNNVKDSGEEFIIPLSRWLRGCMENLDSKVFYSQGRDDESELLSSFDPPSAPSPTPSLAPSTDRSREASLAPSRDPSPEPGTSTAPPAAGPGISNKDYAKAPKTWAGMMKDRVKRFCTNPDCRMFFKTKVILKKHYEAASNDCWPPGDAPESVKTEKIRKFKKKNKEVPTLVAPPIPAAPASSAPPSRPAAPPSPDAPHPEPTEEDKPASLAGAKRQLFPDGQRTSTPKRTTSPPKKKLRKQRRKNYRDENPERDELGLTSEEENSEDGFLGRPGWSGESEGSTDCETDEDKMPKKMKRAIEKMKKAD